jgi:hypothetical protein
MPSSSTGRDVEAFARAADNWMYCMMYYTIRDHLAIVDEHQHLLVHRIGTGDQLALVL